MQYMYSIGNYELNKTHNPCVWCPIDGKCQPFFTYGGDCVYNQREIVHHKHLCDNNNRVYLNIIIIRRVSQNKAECLNISDIKKSFINVKY